MNDASEYFATRRFRFRRDRSSVHTHPIAFPAEFEICETHDVPCLVTPSGQGREIAAFRHCGSFGVSGLGPVSAGRRFQRVPAVGYGKGSCWAAEAVPFDPNVRGGRGRERVTDLR